MSQNFQLLLTFTSVAALRSTLDLLERTDTAVSQEVTPVADVITTPVVETTKATPAVATDAVDVDGMPHNSDYHAMPPQTVGNGKWKSKRGKVAEHEAARAAFLAGGGAVTQAAPVTQQPAALPGTAAALPGTAQALPGANVIPTRAPVSFDEVIGKCAELVDSGKITDLTPLYAEHTGGDASKAADVLQTNETARASLMDALLEIEAG